jgi:hypothetical protein
MDHFDMAREMTRLMDAGKSSEECATEILRMFPSATGADLERALCIGLDHLEMLEAKQMAACQDLADKWFNWGSRTGDRRGDSTPEGRKAPVKR